jgi:hypothetical protein
VQILVKVLVISVLERILGNPGPFVVMFRRLRKKDVVQLSGGRLMSPGPETEGLLLLVLLLREAFHVA